MDCQICKYCDVPNNICIESRMILFRIFGTNTYFPDGCYEHYSYILQNNTPEELRNIVKEYINKNIEEKREEKDVNTKKRKALNNSSEKSKKLKETVSHYPQIGMIVNVRFEEGFYLGIITKIHKDNIHFDITFSDFEIGEKYSFIKDKNDIKIISYPQIDKFNKSIDVRFKLNNKRYKMWKGTIVSQIDKLAFVKFSDNTCWIVLIKNGKYGIGIGNQIIC